MAAFPQIRMSSHQDAEGFRPMHKKDADLLQDYIARPCTYTVFDDRGQVIGIFGWENISDTVAECWAIPSARLKTSAHAAHEYIKAIRSVITTGFRTIPELNRAQAVCRADQPACARFLEALGFRREAVLKEYCDDRVDGYLYALLRSQLELEDAA